MTHLGLDIGSSSVKAGVLDDRGRVVGPLVHASFPTCHDGVRVEVGPDAMLGAVASAIRQLGARARKVDLIGLSVMSPAWVAMDRRGNALTPIVTHQDRRSVEIAKSLEAKVGEERYLRLAGNRPFPGGISVTTWAWYLRHEPGRLRRADLVGHLNTFLHRQFTGARVIDPANASFTGLYCTVQQSSWNDELCRAAGVDVRQLPQVHPSNEVGGTITPDAARRFGLTAGTPVVTGIVDTSSAMLLLGSRPGQLLNVCGSTDVLALCSDKPRPHPRLLTRALGVGKRWMSVSTMAAAGSALNWAKDQIFPEMERSRYWKLAAKLGRSEEKRTRRDVPVRFENYLAGDRTSIEQRQASFHGLTLATQREELLAAVIESLAEASAARIALLLETGTRMRRDVVVSGGVRDGLDKILHRDWPGRWTFRPEEEATLRGLSRLIPSSSR